MSLYKHLNQYRSLREVRSNHSTTKATINTACVVHLGSFQTAEAHAVAGLSIQRSAGRHRANVASYFNLCITSCTPSPTRPKLSLQNKTSAAAWVSGRPPQRITRSPPECDRRAGPAARLRPPASSAGQRASAGRLSRRRFPKPRCSPGARHRIADLNAAQSPSTASHHTT